MAECALHPEVIAPPSLAAGLFAFEVLLARPAPVFSDVRNLSPIF
jgi:hypothetical protein